jgi:ankyrin repeat protein
MSRKRGRLSFLDDMKLPHDLEDIIHQFMMMSLDQRVENFGDLVELFEDEKDMDQVAYYAIKYNNLRLLQYAISRGIDKERALGWASHEGHLDIVKYLVSQGANVDKKAFENAVEEGHLEVANFLISQDSFINSINNEEERRSILYIAYLLNRMK